jgi:hypothetical protein
MAVKLGRSKARGVLKNLDAMERGGEITAREKQILNSRIRRGLREKGGSGTRVRFSSYGLNWKPDA